MKEFKEDDRAEFKTDLHVMLNSSLEIFGADELVQHVQD